MFFYLLYIIALICILFPTLKLVNYYLLNENTIFLLATNYILNIASALFFGFFHNYLFASIFLFMLLIFSTFLIKEFKKILGFYQLLSIPYLLVVSYSFVYTLILFFQSI